VRGGRADALPPTDDPRFADELGWQLREPIEDPADADRTGRLIQDLYFARAESIVDAPAALESYGLASPAVEVTLGTEEGGTQATIALGRSDRGVYARVDGTGPVFGVEERVLDTVPRELFDYRFKRVLSIRRADVVAVRLVFARAGRTYRFELEDDRWVERGGDARPEGQRIDPSRVEEVIYAVEFLEATGVIEGEALKPLGLETPALRSVFEGEGGAELGWLELGDPDPARGVPARSSRGPRVWWLSDEIRERMPLGLDRFESVWVIPEGAPDRHAPGAPEAPDPDEP